jgi:hypothetical protein
MFIETQEHQDWFINPDDSNEIRKNKSIETYWLNNWYDKMKEHTFSTIIYDNIDTIPDILPFNRCAVRYENKSPKDSEFWKPINTKEELINIFYTSLRCKKGQGKYYCVREWKDLGNEYRCFWNNGLVAISCEEDTEPLINIIIEYISKLPIIYYKCVFDIAFLKDSEEMIFIEYNSWETNSGGHNFNWKNDTYILYPIEENNVVIRWKNNGEKIINQDATYIHNNNPLITNRIKFHRLCDNLTRIQFIMNHNEYKYIINDTPQNWLITDKYIYISNDIWLGRFDFNLKPLNWTRGVFRFSSIKLCENNIICVGDTYYYSDLSSMRLNEFSEMPKIIKKLSTIDNSQYYNDNEIPTYKYGIPIKNNKTDEIIFIHLLANCSLVNLEET